MAIEIDGKHHYASDDGRADPREYSEMVAADRELRLLGYEVYGFGGYELMRHDKAERVDRFFDALFAKHRPGERA